VQFVYTLPTTTTGLADSGLAVLRNAKANNARIDIVNIMTFDYFDNAGTHNMANDTKTAATGLHAQLQNLFPATPSAAIWRMIGVTEMIGIDDFGPAAEWSTAGSRPVRWPRGPAAAPPAAWSPRRCTPAQRPCGRRPPRRTTPPAPRS
jgi:hypothetical protein